MASPEQSRRFPRNEPGSSAARPEPANPTHDLLARLERAIGEIHDSASFRRYLDAQARFHEYSFGNVALILSQRPDATAVAGYNAWLRLNRHVRKGEKAIRILAPMSRKDETEDGEQKYHLFFRAVSVFDVSQTEGEPLPELPVPLLEGEAGGPLMERLLLVAQTEGVHVALARGELPGSAAGAYWPAERTIRVRSGPMRQMTKTLAHELGHHFHETRLGGETESRAERETIAESVAYVVCSHYGLDTGERSFPYVATWAKEPLTFKAALQSIQKLSATLIDRLDGRPAAHDDAGAEAETPGGGSGQGGTAGRKSLRRRG